MDDKYRAQNGNMNMFHRFDGNPILSADKWPYPVNSVFNPAAVKVDDNILLLVRVEDHRGFSHLTTARSEDGRGDWRIDPTPTLTRDEGFQEEIWGLEDPRVVWLEDRERYAITYTSFSPGGPQVSLAMTEDFKTFDRKGTLVPPEDKDSSLFPRKFDDRYVLIHRPIVKREAHIWISLSPDLVHWGEHRILISPRGGWWDCHRVGLGPPPIETPEGWLIIYHGVRETAAGNLYRVGLALLDLAEPWKLIRRSEEWVFGPKTEYEFIGDVPGVVFPTGSVIDKEANELMIYYGAADTTVAMAYANLKEVIDYVRNCPAS